MSGRSPATVSSKRASYASRVSPALRCHGITCTRETPADRARSIAYARGLLHTTEATSSGSAPAAQPSSTACKFEPLPDAITTAAPAARETVLRKTSRPPAPPHARIVAHERLVADRRNHRACKPAFAQRRKAERQQRRPKHAPTLLCRDPERSEHTRARISPRAAQPREIQPLRIEGRKSHRRAAAPRDEVLRRIRFRAPPPAERRVNPRKRRIVRRPPLLQRKPRLGQRFPCSKRRRRRKPFAVEIDHEIDQVAHAGRR